MSHILLHCRDDVAFSYNNTYNYFDLFPACLLNSWLHLTNGDFKSYYLNAGIYIYTFTLLGSISLATKQPALSGIFTTPEEAS